MILQFRIDIGKHEPRKSSKSGWGIILGIGSANEAQRYNVTSSLIGWAHTRNDPKSLPLNSQTTPHSPLYAMIKYCQVSNIRRTLVGN